MKRFTRNSHWELADIYIDFESGATHIQKSGLYRTKVKIGVDAKGKDVFKYVSGRMMRELKDAKRGVIAQFIEGEASARIDDSAHMPLNGTGLSSLRTYLRRQRNSQYIVSGHPHWK